MEVSGHSHVADGSCRISVGMAASADLVIVQSAETFVKTRIGIQNPTLALWTGKIQVQGWHNLGTFEKVFPITSLDFAPAPRETCEGRIVSLAEMLVQTHAE